MNKRVYETPVCSVLQFEKSDVVCTSGGGGDVYVKDEFEENWDLLA